LRADAAGLVALLAEDARFTMPPLPAWFSGRDDIGRFAAERLFATLQYEIYFNDVGPSASSSSGTGTTRRSSSTPRTSATI
jgi:hypothetical protein